MIWGLCFLAIVAQRSALAQVSGEFWWLNPALMEAAGKNRQEKEFREEGSSEEPEDDSIDCFCVPKCQCDDPPVDLVFESEKHDSCAPMEKCCHLLKLPIPANCSSSITFTENTLEHDGSPLAIKEFPWLLSLSYETLPNVCGAAILTSTAAVTAAHCVAGTKYPSSYSIRTTEGYERILSEIIQHRGYYSGGRFNDLALIKWEKPLATPHGSNVIQLADNEDLTDENSSCFAIELDNNHPIPLNVMSPFLCEAILREGRLGRRFQLHSSFLCAVSDLPGTCKAQGGNLLVCQKPGSIPLLAGVASWGFKCNEPRIFTNISVFSNWINDNLIKYYF